MCKHNDEDRFDCAACCREHGENDYLDGLDRDPPYKNFWQVDEYNEGYEKNIDADKELATLKARVVYLEGKLAERSKVGRELAECAIAGGEAVRLSVEEMIEIAEKETATDE